MSFITKFINRPHVGVKLIIMSVGDPLSAVLNLEVYDLGQPYFNGMPVHPEDPPFSMVIYRYHDYTRRIFEKVAPGFSDSMELIVTSMHSGTHIDALCHMARDGTLHAGVKASDISHHAGYRRYGAEEMPIFVKRCVLLDVAGFKGMDLLPERYGITPSDLEGAEKWAGVSIRKGDAALVRTGYSRFFQTDREKYLHGFAGITDESARWLVNRGVSLFGIDNLAMAVPKPFYAHLIFLVDAGVHIMKSLYLEKLAADRQYESVLVVAPLKIIGATGSLIRPIALAPKK